jgi:hypothetical protein
LAAGFLVQIVELTQRLFDPYDLDTDVHAHLAAPALLVLLLNYLTDSNKVGSVKVDTWRPPPD